MTIEDVIALHNEMAKSTTDPRVKQIWLDASEAVTRLRDGQLNQEQIDFTHEYEQNKLGGDDLPLGGFWIAFHVKRKRKA